MSKKAKAETVADEVLTTAAETEETAQETGQETAEQESEAEVANTKAETVAKTAEAEITAKEETAGATQARVWCGPSIRHVARQYTVYSGELPEALEAFLEEKPMARGLLVPLDRLAETRIRTEQSGTAEAILYKKIKSQI